MRQRTGTGRPFRRAFRRKFREGSATRACVLLIPAGFAFALGIWGIRRGGTMWRDEAVTDAVSARDLGELWALVQHVDAVHGTYYLVMHGWAALCGDGLVALRLPSVAATALAAAGVAALGRELASPRAGTLAGISYAALPVVQQYAQEARAYALVSAGVAWSTWLLLRAARVDKKRYWAGYAAVGLVACWLNLFAAFAVVAHGIALRGHGVPDRAAWRFLTAAASVALGALPLAALSLGQSDEQLDWLARPGTGEWAGYLAVAGAGVLLAALPFRSGARRHGRLRWCALSLLTVPPGALLLLSCVRPYYVDRYVLYSLAGLALLAGAAADHALRPGALPVRAPVPAAGAALVLLALLVPWHADTRTPGSRKDDAVAVASTVRDLSAPGDTVLFTPARRRDWLLHDPAVYRRLHDVALRRTPEESGTLRGVELPPRAVRDHLRHARRVLVLEDPAGKPLDRDAREVAKRRALHAYFRLCRTLPVRGARIALWERGRACPVPSVPCPDRALGHGPDTRGVLLRCRCCAAT